MSEELNVNQNTENLEEELDLELEPEEAPQTEDAEADKDARIAELERKNKQLFARLKKPQSKPYSKPTEELQEIREAVGKLSLAEQKRQFQYENNLSPEETDKVFAINPKPTKELLDDPFVKGGLESIRAARRVSEATPSPSGKSPTVDGKSWAEMTKEERQKNYGNVVKGMTGRK